MNKCDLFVLAGEKSGDLHGEKILSSLLNQMPSLNVAGVGGPLMRGTGMNCILPMEELQVMGFIDVFRSLPKLTRIFYDIRGHILNLNPKAVLFIDYPGFNLRMATHLRNFHYKGDLCQFVCPSVWAWKKNRIALMEKHLNLLLCILPFEPKLFENSPLTAHYVGHPLTTRVAQTVTRRLAFPDNKTIIALFPGSRQKEIARNLPIYLRVVNKLSNLQTNLLFPISISDTRYLPLITQLIEKEAPGCKNILPLISPEQSYDLMQTSDYAIAKSGTVTLELALHQIPTIVTYAITKLDTFIARDLLRIRLPFYALPNIILQKELFPELFGPNFTEHSLLSHITALLSSEDKVKICREACVELISLLENKDAAKETASLLKRLLSSEKNEIMAPC